MREWEEMLVLMERAATYYTCFASLNYIIFAKKKTEYLLLLYLYDII